MYTERMRKEEKEGWKKGRKKGGRGKQEINNGWKYQA
jgi:hypothetical protein